MVPSTECVERPIICDDTLALESEAAVGICGQRSVRDPDTLCESGKGFRIGFHPPIVRCCRSTKHLDLVQRIRLEKAGKIDQWRRRQRRRSSCQPDYSIIYLCWTCNTLSAA